MAKKPTKPAKAKPAAKKSAPAKAKTPVTKNKPAAKKPAKPVVRKQAKPAPKKPAAQKPKVSPAKLAPKAIPKKPAAKTAPKVAPKTTAKQAPKKPAPPVASKQRPPARTVAPAKAPVKVSGWLAKQRTRLLNLKDELLDSMKGVGRDTLRTRAEGSDASAFGMHTGDAGSDAYDRDFALNLLTQERDSLFEIDAALKKIDDGSYGICEMSGKPIPHIRLEARPFARYTIECQTELEKTNRFTRARQPVTSLFGLGEEDSDSEEEETQTDSKE